MATGSAPARYRKLLSPHGHGYAFWIPEPDGNLPGDQRKAGMRIGDIGILTDDGGFEYLWNMHLPATDPQNYLVPPNFMPVPLDEIRDIRKVDDFFNKDTAITTTSVQKSALKVTGAVEGAAGGIAGGGGFEFTAQGNSGAILTLPRGGVRQNATKLNLYMQEASAHATSWYQHINGTLQRGMLNGALYLVTGTDKCSSWGVASFATSSESHGLSLKFMVSSAASSGASVSNSWSADFGVEHRTKAVDEGELSQCVFARGYSISLRDKLYLETIGWGVRVTSLDGSETNPASTFFGSKRPYSRSIDSNRAPSNVHSTQETRTRDADADWDESPDADADVRVTRVPDSQPQKGVAALIGDELLKQNPDAVVAIVHDDDWIASTRSDDFRAADDSQSVIEDLVHHVLTHSSAVVVDGVCTLAVLDGVAPSGDTPLGRDPSMSMSGRPQPEPERLGLARRADMPQAMGIHQDALQGTLDEEKLTMYLASNTNILEEKDPARGLTPLAAAAVAGYADVVDLLLKRGARADALSEAGETPLLLTARDGSSNRGRIVQLLLAKMPAGSIDATTARDKKSTPLMYAVLNKDLESVRQLRKSGASLAAKNDDGLTAQDLADSDRNIVRAFHSESDPGTVVRLAWVVLSALLYVIEWVSEKAQGFANGFRHRWYGPSPELGEIPFEVDGINSINETLKLFRNPEDLVSEVLLNDPVLERFFKDNPNYIREVSNRATTLHVTTVLATRDLLPKTIKVFLHQQVIYCDDSWSMKTGDRWAAQAEFVKRLAQITTSIVPKEEGVALRFINQTADDSPNLSLEQVRDIMQTTSWKPSVDGEKGNSLRAKVLQPLVYSKLDVPSYEACTALVQAIKECGDKLQAAGYPRDSVKFMIGCVGTSTLDFDALRMNQEITDVAFVSQAPLDERFDELKGREADLDRWLIETLFSAVKGTKRSN